MTEETETREQEEDENARLVVEAYARSKGMPVEEAMKSIYPALKAQSRNPLVSQAMEACHVLSEVKEASQGADPTTRELLSALAGSVVGQSMSGKTGDPVDEAMRDVTKYVAKIKVIEGAFGSGNINKVMDEVNKLRSEIQDTKKSAEIQSIIDKMAELVTPLQERLESLEAEKGKTPPGGGDKPVSQKEILAQVNSLTDESKLWLQTAGYRVEMDKGLSGEEINKRVEEARREAIEKLPPDELKDRLQKAGYKVVGGPMTYEETQKLVEEAVAKTQEAALDDKRISAVENIIRDSIAQVIEMFKKPMEGYFATMVQSRQSGEPPAPAPAE